MAEIHRSTNHKRMTSNLMTAVFGRKIMAESSVTGRGKDSRPPLDRTKVELIIGQCLTVYGLTLYSLSVLTSDADKVKECES